MKGRVKTMLIQFNFKNFKSFRDEATLDLSAAKMTEFSNRVISVGNEKILPVAAVYGANASGKSNVYGAFEYMSEYVVHSFKYGDEEKDFDESGKVSNDVSDNGLSGDKQDSFAASEKEKGEE